MAQEVEMVEVEEEMEIGLDPEAQYDEPEGGEGYAIAICVMPDGRFNVKRTSLDLFYDEEGDLREDVSVIEEGVEDPEEALKVAYSEYMKNPVGEVVEVEEEEEVDVDEVADDMSTDEAMGEGVVAFGEEEDEEAYY